jgi:hypothetical protein
MNEHYADIIFHKDYNRVTGDIYISHITWEPAHLPARIHRRHENLDDIKKFFEIEKLFEVTTYESLMYGDLYIRTDAGMSYAYHRYMNFWRNRVWYPWRWIEVRLILTLQVWGLAYNEPGCYVSWSSVGKKR